MSKNKVELKPSSYQPTKAEMEEEISIPIDPNLLGKAIVTGGVPRRKVKKGLRKE